MGAPMAFLEILSRGEHERARRPYSDLFGRRIGADPDGNPVGLWS
ncbi:hypothetical protein AB0J86_22535 [Micromonospora sp. NPDC049559]